jgi:hypothetical protein
LRAALEAVRPFLDLIEDRGPSGEGWKSDELRAAIARADKALKL